MKKICLFVAIAMILCAVPAFASSDAPVVMSYTHTPQIEQGIDGWYYIEKDTEEKFMEYNPSNERWWGEFTASNTTSNMLLAGEFNPGQYSDVGVKFVAPYKGMVRIKCKFEQPYPDSAKGDGIKGRVLKGNREIWSGNVKYGSPANCEIELSIRKGDEIKFYINRGVNNYYDWSRMVPTIEYLGMEYKAEDEEKKFFERRNGELMEMAYDEESDRYIASDGLAVISDYEVMPTKECSVLKRYKVEETGRHRILLNLYSEDMRGGGVVISLYKNGKKFWKQLCIDDEDAVVDVRAYAKTGDLIDVEVSANEFNGYNMVDWNCDISKYVGTLPSTEISSQGFKFITEKSEKLSSIASMASDTGALKVYAVKNDLPVSMKMEGAKWVTDIEGHGGYISGNEIYPGDGADIVFEKTMQEDAYIHINGELSVNSNSDGVVVKILHNGKEVWSSRVGGARAVRWDEPYDTSYFAYHMNTMLKVNNGDKLLFIFDQWRTPKNDIVDISDIKIDYVKGSLLSRTTEWKLSESVVIDTVTQTVYQDGKATNACVKVIDGKTYINENVLGTENEGKAVIADGIKLIPVREAAENNGQSVAWAANRFVIIHDNLPQFFGWSELSEINSAVKGGVLFE